MDNRLEEKTEKMISDEAERYRAAANEHAAAAKEARSTFRTTGVIMLAIIAIVALIGFGWFVFNNRVKGLTGTISAAGQADFALATVGNNSQGVYDGIFHLMDNLTTETIGETDYYVASGNSSFRVDSDKNLNNYLDNADLRPGNRGTFDLYVICRTAKREVVLQPVFSAWNGIQESNMEDAFSHSNTTISTAAEFLKGHILLFAKMDEKGMYSGNIDFTKEIKLNLSTGKASQEETSQENVSHEFSWGESVFSDGNIAVYRLPVYWVWPEQFGNFIYTGNSYNKNLFAEKKVDYDYFIREMEDETGYKKFFCIEGEDTRPEISTITSPTDYQTATQNYELYSGWYNVADEMIGEYISYIELGFEIAQDN